MIDINKYIQSGIIEEYVLNNLSEVDRGEVERIASLHPEIANEIFETSESLSLYGKLGAVTAPAYMQERLWEAVNKPNIAPKVKTTNAQANKKIKSTNWAKYSAVAAFSLITFLALFWGVKASNKLAEIEATVKQLKTNNEEINEKLIVLQKLVDDNYSIYRLPNIKLVILNSYKSKSLAILIWDKDQNDIYLDIKVMEENDVEKEKYHLWSITDIGLQSRIGTFDYKSENRIIKVGEVEGAVQFQVTRESDMNVKRPNAANLILKGNVGY